MLNKIVMHVKWIIFSNWLLYATKTIDVYETILDIMAYLHLTL